MMGSDPQQGVQPIPGELRSIIQREFEADFLRYMLAMYWQGRSDKIPSPLMPALQWISEHGVAADVPGPRIFEHGRCMFVESDHHALLREALQMVEDSLSKTEERHADGPASA